MEWSLGRKDITEKDRHIYEQSLKALKLKVKNQMEVVINEKVRYTKRCPEKNYAQLQ